MTLRVHVLHVPGVDSHRDEMVKKLQSEVEVCLHVDPARRGVMPTWLETLSCAISTDTSAWSVILQDDVEGFPNWQWHLTKATTYSPEPYLSLTPLWRYGERPLAKGAPYAVGKNLMRGAAVAMHRGVIPGLRSFAEQVYLTTGYKHDDRLLAAYAARTGRKTAMLARALFDLPVEKSLLGHAPRSRRPTTTIANHPGPLPRYGTANRSISISTSWSPDMAALLDFEEK